MTENPEPGDEADPNDSEPTATGTESLVSRRGALTTLGAAGLFGLLSPGTASAEVLSGVGNTAPRETQVVAGGKNNEATGAYAAVTGGLANAATGDFAAVLGGEHNDAGGSRSTVGGGEQNAAGGFRATVGGGGGNTATSLDAIVGGGLLNAANGRFSAVPGGRGNLARGGYSFAAGRRAKAEHRGTFAWSDSRDRDLASTGRDQFLVDAAGGVGVGTNAPRTQFDVSAAASGDDSVASHAAAVESTADAENARVLALKTNVSGAPHRLTHYLTFRNRDGLAGSIEGNGSGGVVLRSSGADVAEHFPKADPASAFEDGEVVGLRDGRLTRTTDGVDAAFVVTDRPIVLGNAPDEADAGAGTDEAASAPVALLGQVPVEVRGPVEPGDLLVATGDADGRARAVDEGRRPTDVPAVGRALTASEADGTVRAFVNAGIDASATKPAGERGSASAAKADRVAALEATIERRDERIADLKAENERKDERIDDLESRLAAVERAVGAPSADPNARAD